MHLLINFKDMGIAPLRHVTKIIDRSYTNNGVEIMNKVIKYSSEKKRRKVIPVPEMITVGCAPTVSAEHNIPNIN